MTLDVAGHNIEVVALADVVRSKTAAGRPKDQATLDTLRQWVSSLKALSAEDLREQMHEALLGTTLTPPPAGNPTPTRIDRTYPSPPHPGGSLPVEPGPRPDEPPPSRSPHR